VVRIPRAVSRGTRPNVAVQVAIMAATGNPPGARQQAVRPASSSQTVRPSKPAAENGKTARTGELWRAANDGDLLRVSQCLEAGSSVDEVDEVRGRAFMLHSHTYRQSMTASEWFHKSQIESMSYAPAHACAQLALM